MKLTNDEKAYSKFYSAIEANKTDKIKTADASQNRDSFPKYPEQSTNPRFNKAQGKPEHSPLPWHAATTGAGVAAVIFSGHEAIGNSTTENAKLIVASVNHAEALAAVIRYTLNGGTDMRVLKNVLADYERAKQ